MKKIYWVIAHLGAKMVSLQDERDCLLDHLEYIQKHSKDLESDLSAAQARIAELEEALSAWKNEEMERKWELGESNARIAELESSRVAVEVPREVAEWAQNRLAHGLFMAGHAPPSVAEFIQSLCRPAPDHASDACPHAEGTQEWAQWHLDRGKMVGRNNCLICMRDGVLQYNLSGTGGRPGFVGWMKALLPH